MDSRKDSTIVSGRSKLMAVCDDEKDSTKYDKCTDVLKEEVEDQSNDWLGIGNAPGTNMNNDEEEGDYKTEEDHGINRYNDDVGWMNFIQQAPNLFIDDDGYDFDTVNFNDQHASAIESEYFIASSNRDSDTSPPDLALDEDDSLQSLSYCGEYYQNLHNPTVAHESPNKATTLASSAGSHLMLKEWQRIEYRTLNNGEGTDNSLPPPMSGLTATLYDRLMFVFGGYHNGEALDGLYSFDLDTHIWRIVETIGNKPAARTSHSTVVDTQSGKLYVCCGSGSAFGHTNLGDVYELDIGYRMWRKLEFQGDALSPRYGQSVIIRDAKLYMFGGTFGREFSREFFVMDLRTMRATKQRTTGALPSPRYKHAVALYGENDSEMLVFGGAERLNYRLNDTYSLDLNTFRWTYLQCTGDLPQGRFAHSMVVAHRNKAFVFGGTDRVNCRNDLYMLDLTVRIWTRIDATGTIPRGRYFHGSIYDPLNEQMIVWGGKGSTSEQVRFDDLFSIQLQQRQKHHELSARRGRQQCSLAHDLLLLLQSQDCADVIIVCPNGHMFKAHYLILRARCPLFVDLFKSNHQHDNNAQQMSLDIDDNEDVDKIVVHVPYSRDCIQLLLHYIYGDELIVNRNMTIDDDNHYVDLFLAANKLSLTRLEAMCEARIRLHLNRSIAQTCLARMKNQLPVLHRFEEFMLKYVHVNLSECKEPDSRGDGSPTPDYFSEIFGESRQDDGEYMRPVVINHAHVSIPPSALHEDIASLRLRNNNNNDNNNNKDVNVVRYPSEALIRFRFEDNERDEWAHALLLSARSTYFGSYSFRHGMLEASLQECAFPSQFSQTVLSPHAFSVLLDYLYSGDRALNSITISIAIEFIAADVCNYYGLSNTHLDHHCHEFITSSKQDDDMNGARFKPNNGCLLS